MLSMWAVVQHLAPGRFTDHKKQDESFEKDTLKLFINFSGVPVVNGGGDMKRSSY